ncbi:CU044_5270 family protein [Yinghuangia seranimata]|uniref:CU044_5270 family protein n=1 Tax=Yinghuangia seranimata TaxID=408067 RepID=UPI00248BCAB9|nr:CU044_5270 family protein [Yinghuangia seranimata]MDI2130643.1 CU044_5270 family protein [Yinghuangia seranimata]
MNTNHRHPQPPRPDERERRELAALLPPPTVPDLARDRELLLKEDLMRKTHPASPDSGTQATRPAARPRRWAWVAVPVAACALAGGLVAANLGGGSDDTPVASPTSQPAPGVPAPNPAVQLLTQVAHAAAGNPQPTVRADQFVYVESKVAYAAQSADGGPATVPQAHTRRVWLSADGSRPGLIREDGKPDSTTGDQTGQVFTLEGPGATPKPSTLTTPPSITNPTHQYVASLPTDPDTLLQRVYAETKGQGQDPDQRAFTAIGDLLTETWAPPQVTAALYQAAAKIPGVTVVESATDAAGREGIAVARTAHNEQTQWIFDRKTNTFLGDRTILTAPTDAGPTGTVLGTSAILTKAAVSKAGETPKQPTT